MIYKMPKRGIACRFGVVINHGDLAAGLATSMMMLLNPQVKELSTFITENGKYVVIVTMKYQKDILCVLKLMNDFSTSSNRFWMTIATAGIDSAIQMNQ